MMMDTSEGGALASALANYLQMAVISDLGLWRIVSGILNVPVREHISKRDMQVPVCVVIRPSWSIGIPRFHVLRKADWVKSGPQWHMFDGVICLEWGQRWQEHIAILKEKTRADIPDIAAQWIKNSASHVLQIHYACHVLGKTDWPPSIPSWPHPPAEASAEYEREKKLLKIRR